MPARNGDWIGHHSMQGVRSTVDSCKLLTHATNEKRINEERGRVFKGHLAYLFDGDCYGLRRIKKG